MFSVASSTKNNGLPLREYLYDGSFAFHLRSTAYLRIMLNLSTGPEATVQEVQFDAFGEPVKHDENRASIASKSISSWALLAGVGLFWLLVAVTIVARVFYFDPDFASKFH